MRVASPVLQYRGGFYFYQKFALTGKNICSIIASIQKMEGESMKTTYDKIVELLKKATDRQLNLIYRFVRGLLKD